MLYKNVYIGLGSNIGKSLALFKSAIELLEAHAITIKSSAAVYRSAPWGRLEQPDFLNTVLNIALDYEPLELLELISKIEVELGRVRDIHWGPRTIDLDILLFAGKKINTEKLCIPHKFIYERSFVYVPLAEVWEEEYPLPISPKRIERERSKLTMILPRNKLLSYRT